MRASEIRNLLIQKYGFSPEAIARILDKNELKKLLLAEMVKGQSKEKYEHLKSSVYSSIYSILYVLAGIVLFAFALRSIIEYVRNLRSNKDKGMTKLKLVFRHFRKGYVLASIVLFVSVVLDVVSSWMTLSTFLSWIIPHDSPFRRLLIPMFSFPLNSSMVSDIATGNVRGSSRGGYGIDIGPMLTIGLVNWLIHQTQEWSSSLVLERMKQKDERKQKKAKKNSFDSSQHDSDFSGLTKRKHPSRDSDVDISTAFMNSMKKSRARGLTDDPIDKEREVGGDDEDKEEEEEEFDIRQLSRSVSEPPLPSSSADVAAGDSVALLPDAVVELTTLNPDHDEVRRLSQHFARMHSREVNNETVHYTREDQIDICILDRLASICEETPEEVAKETNVTPVFDLDREDQHTSGDGKEDDERNSPYNPLPVETPEEKIQKYSPLSMTRAQSEAMLDNLQNVDYYTSEDPAVSLDELEVAQIMLDAPVDVEVLSPNSSDRRSTVSEDSDDEVYREAVAVSGDAYDQNHTEE